MRARNAYGLAVIFSIWLTRGSLLGHEQHMLDESVEGEAARNETSSGTTGVAARSLESGGAGRYRNRRGCDRGARDRIPGDRSAANWPDWGQERGVRATRGR